MSRHLEITTYIDCPNKCSYCPQDTLIKAYKGQKTMLLEDFRKILKNVPSDVDIHFSGYSEPFFHPDIIDFILEANVGHDVVVYTTTMGMSDIQSEQLKDIKFKQFVVHNIGDIKELPFAHDVVTVTDDTKISRAGHLWENEGKGEICTRSWRFEQNVVLPNGDVYLCCMDYGLEHKLGNLFKTNFNNLDRLSIYNLCRRCEVSR